MRLVFFSFLIVVAWPFALDLALSTDRDRPGQPRLRDKLISYISWARLEPELVAVGLVLPQEGHDGCLSRANIRHALPPEPSNRRFMVIRGPILTV